MAHEAEYGPALRARITPLMTGIGPTEAAIVTATALANLAAANALPDMAICLGSAGSAKLNQGEIYQVSAVSYRDMDASPLGFEKGITPFSNLPARLPLRQIPNLPAASLATGASVVNAPDYATINADMVDMETWSVARACMMHNLPLIGLRGISDGTEPLETIASWTDLLPILDTRLAATLDHIAPHL